MELERSGAPLGKSGEAFWEVMEVCDLIEENLGFWI